MNIFGVTVKTSVDSVLAAFQQTIADLKEVRDHHLAKVEQHTATIAEATEARDASSAESVRAANAITKFNDLLGNI